MKKAPTYRDLWKRLNRDGHASRHPLRHPEVLRAIKLFIACSACIGFIALFPAPFWPEDRELPYYGDFSWHAEDPVRLSDGDCRELGRGGAEDYIPNLHLSEYIIRKGDTLWNISKDFDVYPDTIISCNVFTNVHSIHEGDTILVPNISGIFVNIGEGDTIYQYSSFTIRYVFIKVIKALEVVCIDSLSAFNFHRQIGSPPGDYKVNLVPITVTVKQKVVFLSFIKAVLKDF